MSRERRFSQMQNIVRPITSCERRFFTTVEGFPRPVVPSLLLWSTPKIHPLAKPCSFILPMRTSQLVNKNRTCALSMKLSRGKISPSWTSCNAAVKMLLLIRSAWVAPPLFLGLRQYCLRGLLEGRGHPSWTCVGVENHLSERREDTVCDANRSA